jgi:hypothetical protein
MARPRCRSGRLASGELSGAANCLDGDCRGRAEPRRFIFVNRHVTAESEPARPSQRQWFDLPLRAASVAAFVSLVVAVSAALGPAATGIAAVFPVSLISLIVILRPRLGGPITARLATNALLPMLGFGIMLFVMHVGVQSSGVAAGFGFALAVCVIWSGVLLLLQACGRYG